ncbi:uncharacterized protein LOC143269825 [Peromyscus maniculatus bairdii]|uniref:uncharacterized protein LOC143269825 n=1 Tax=Peromyscus maniculatus bairdii TaxID=230844 RepID=UPI003FD105E4
MSKSPRRLVHRREKGLFHFLHGSLACRSAPDSKLRTRQPDQVKRKDKGHGLFQLLFGAPHSGAPGERERWRCSRSQAALPSEPSQRTLRAPYGLAERAGCLPSVKMAAAAPPRHGARAPPFAPPSSGPPGRHPSHPPAAALRASPASPLLGGPLLPRLPGPEVDVAARQRSRGGGRSASGETGPGLVFVNLPRSRRGQRRPRAWHGVRGAPGGGAARRRRRREAAPGRFLEQT